jgi:hypothetical protein
MRVLVMFLRGGAGVSHPVKSDNVFDAVKSLETSSDEKYFVLREEGKKPLMLVCRDDVVMFKLEEPQPDRAPILVPQLAVPDNGRGRIR